MKYTGSLVVLLVIGSCLLALTSTVSAESVLAWGSNSAGLLLTGDNSTSVIPVLVAPSSFENAKVVSIAAGTSFGVAANANGDVFTWGSNLRGQLGLGASSGIAYSQAPVKVPSLGSSISDPVVQVAASTETALALTASGLVWSWGSNSRGLLGNGTGIAETGFESSPVWVSDRVVDNIHLGAVSMIGCGFDYCGALTVENQVYMWGSNENGQLGYLSGTFQYVTVPAKINMTGFEHVHFKQMSFGGKHVLALTNDSVVVSWGSNNEAQLGLRFQGGSSFWPVRANFTASAGDRVIQVAAGNAHSLVLTEAGSIYGWGLAQYYQLGYVPAFLYQLDPYPFSLLNYIWGKVTNIYVVADTSFVTSDRGRTYSWGVGAGYILGLNQTDNSPGPVKLNLTAVPDDYTITYISASAFATTAYAIANETTLPPFDPVSPGTPATPGDQEPPPYSPSSPVLTPMAPSTAVFTPFGASTTLAVPAKSILVLLGLLAAVILA